MDASPPALRDPSPGSTLALAALLLALTFALFARASTFEFLNYDDDVYVTANEGVRGGLSAEGLRWALTTGHAANWHPLTWVSHQLDVELFGLEPGPHHRTNVVLHALGAALLFLALQALTRARGASFLVAALYALHPLRIECVAWVAERKDLLAGLFAFASLGLWGAWARRGGAARYGASLLAFACSLMAKPMAVTLPALLLVLDVWPLARHRTHALAARLRATLPFWALALASSLVTLRVQQAGGAVGPLDGLPLGARLANAISATGTYAWRTLWPSSTCVFHPHPALFDPARGPWTAGVLASAAALLVLTLALARLRRRAPFAWTGWLWFLGTLVPMLGLVQVGLQGWAERYATLPSIGLGIALVFAGQALLGPRHPRAGLGLAAVALAALALATHRQLAPWHDSRSLFEHALLVEESPVAHVNLARALEEQGDLVGAEAHTRRALELVPGLAGARVNLARLLRLTGRPAEARAELERALAVEPDSVLVQGELGWLLVELGEDAEALAHLRRAVELAPRAPALRNNLAWLLATSARVSAPEEARALAADLCRESQGRQAAHLETLAAALARLGRFEEAIAVQEQALERIPDARRAEPDARLARYRRGEPYVRP